MYIPYIYVVVSFSLYYTYTWCWCSTATTSASGAAITGWCTRDLNHGRFGSIFIFHFSLLPGCSSLKSLEKMVNFCKKIYISLFLHPLPLLHVNIGGLVIHVCLSPSHRPLYSLYPSSWPSLLLPLIIFLTLTNPCYPSLTLLYPSL